MRTWLIDLRNQKKFTQEQLAKIVGISRSMYSMIELGERNPSVAVAKKIAAILEFEWTLFFGEEGHDTWNFLLRDPFRFSLANLLFI